MPTTQVETDYLSTLKALLELLLNPPTKLPPNLDGKLASVSRDSYSLRNLN